MNYFFMKGKEICRREVRPRAQGTPGQGEVPGERRQESSWRTVDNLNKTPWKGIPAAGPAWMKPPQLECRTVAAC